MHPNHTPQVEQSVEPFAHTHEGGSNRDILRAMQCAEAQNKDRQESRWERQFAKTNGGLLAKLKALVLHG